MIEKPDGELYLQQRPQSGIWGGLWSFPEVSSEAEAHSWLKQHLGCEGQAEWLDNFRHTFSHYHLQIQPLKFSLPTSPQPIGEHSSHWYNPANPSELGLAAPVKKLLHLSEI